MQSIITGLTNSLLQEKENLQKRLEDLEREYDRKTYIAAGLAALIVQTNNAELIRAARIIVDEAEALNK